MTIRRTSKILGASAGLASIVLWFLLMPGEFEPMMNTLISLAIPGIVAIIAAIFYYRILMFLAFLVSLPISLYMVLTPSYFVLFGVTCGCYLISFLLMLVDRKDEKVVKIYN